MRKLVSAFVLAAFSVPSQADYAPYAETWDIPREECIGDTVIDNRFNPVEGDAPYKMDFNIYYDANGNVTNQVDIRFDITSIGDNWQQMYAIIDYPNLDYVDSTPIDVITNFSDAAYNNSDFRSTTTQFYDDGSGTEIHVLGGGRNNPNNITTSNANMYHGTVRLNAGAPLLNNPGADGHITVSVTWVVEYDLSGVSRRACDVGNIPPKVCTATIVDTGMDEAVILDANRLLFRNVFLTVEYEMQGYDQAIIDYSYSSNIRNLDILSVTNVSLDQNDVRFHAVDDIILTPNNGQSIGVILNGLEGEIQPLRLTASGQCL